MKMAGFLYIPLFLLFLFFLKSQTFADNITTGNVSSETKVTNNSNGGNVTTHIETTVNGQTTTVDSNDPGDIDVKNENGKVTISKSPNATITITENENSTHSPTITPKPIHKNFLSNFFENIRNFFKRIFHNL